MCERVFQLLHERGVDLDVGACRHEADGFPAACERSRTSRRCCSKRGPIGAMHLVIHRSPTMRATSSTTTEALAIAAGEPVHAVEEPAAGGELVRSTRRSAGRDRSRFLAGTAGVSTNSFAAEVLRRLAGLFRPRE
jgi:hypothetical protein